MKYNGITNINYEQVLKLISNGIIGFVDTDKVGEFQFAHNGGNYLGAPGKEIFFSLSNISNEQVHEISKKLSLLFPVKPPNNHVKWAACIRYIYGCFEKQGCLRSIQDMNRMVTENADWTLPNNFMKLLKNKFEENENKYGLVLWYEMYAHRLGDRAIIENNKSILNEMLSNYLISQELAISIKSLKHTFTPLYWAACYLEKMGMYEECVTYHIKSLESMNKYCPDARDGYREKAKISLLQIKKHDKDWKLWYKNFKKKVKNKCLKKVIF